MDQRSAPLPDRATKATLLAGALALLLPAWSAAQDRGGREQTAVESLIEKADPKADDWDAEVANAELGDPLKHIAHLLDGSEALDLDAAAELVTDGYQAAALRPSELREERADAGLRVLHATKPAPELLEAGGAAGLLQALTQLSDALGEGGERHAKLKVVHVDPRMDEVSAQLRLEASAIHADGAREITISLASRWTRAETDELGPRLIAMHPLEYEEVHLSQPGGALFRDCTADAFGRNASYEEQLVPSINDWVLSVSRMEDMWLSGHHGVAIGDVNGDQLEDVYLCEVGGLPNQLFLQQPDGTFVDASATAGVDWIANSASALLADLDGDGDRDLVVSTRSRVLVHANDGRGVFTLATSIPGPRDPMSMAASDFDLDGDVDFYLCAFQPHPDRSGIPGPVPYMDANNGDWNRLFRNDGGLHFTEATAEVGLDEHNSRFSFAAVWEDFDRDGDLDLYVANDFGRNNLYLQEDGRFRDVAPDAGVEDIASGMGVSTGDANRDGWPDIYVSNMWSSAGKRVTYQRRFEDSRQGDSAARIQRMSRGNTLFLNRGDRHFADISEDAGVTLGRWAWGSCFADLDNDGWEDLFVANGYFTMEKADDL